MTGKDRVRESWRRKSRAVVTVAHPVSACLKSPALTDLLSSFWPSQPTPCPEFCVSVHSPQTSWGPGTVGQAVCSWPKADGHNLPVVTLNISPDYSHLLSLRKGKLSGIIPDAKGSGWQLRPCWELALPFKVKPLASGLLALGTTGIPLLHPRESDLPGLFSQVS